MEENKPVMNLFGMMMLGMMLGVDVGNIDKAKKTLVKVLKGDGEIDEIAGLLNVDKEVVESAVEELRKNIRKKAEEIGVSEEEVIRGMI